jgi:hypothetical protein
MTVLELIDKLYEGFADALGGELAEHAKDLPVALKLAPARVPWSQVFSYEVTLGAPALFARAMPHLSAAVVQDAVAAHMFGVIGAFGADRIEDGQIGVSSAVLSVLSHIRGARDGAFERVCPARPPSMTRRWRTRWRTKPWKPSVRCYGLASPSDSLRTSACRWPSNRPGS